MAEEHLADPSRVLTCVGGYLYGVQRPWLEKYPDSLLAKQLLVPGATGQASDSEMFMNRDGPSFKFICEFLAYDMLPRNKNGFTLLSRSQLETVRKEAEYYQLPALVSECQKFLSMTEVEYVLDLHTEIAGELSPNEYRYMGNLHGKVQFMLSNEEEEEEDEEHTSELVRLLRQIPAPSWVVGKISARTEDGQVRASDESSDGGKEDERKKRVRREGDHDKSSGLIFKSSTFEQLNVEELLAHAKPSPFGHGAQTVMDANVRDSLEIPASELEDLSWLVNDDRLQSVANLLPHMKLKLVPYKLVIYCEGGHFENHRDTVRADDHIGTLVVILNSEYTGGELEITHDDESVLVTGPYQWVAMYGDCVHRIHPVKSGVRVSLILDIMNTREARKHTWDLDGLDWDEYFSKEFSPTEHLRGVIDADLQGRIHAELDKELKVHGSVSIGLFHLYPVCQVNFETLKGEDVILYRMLKDRYKLAVTPVLVSVLKSPVDDEMAMGFSKFTPPNSEEAPGLLSEKNRLLVVPFPCSHYTDYRPGSEYTGNSAQNEEHVYLHGAMVVRKKAEGVPGSLQE